MGQTRFVKILDQDRILVNYAYNYIESDPIRLRRILYVSTIRPEPIG